MTGSSSSLLTGVPGGGTYIETEISQKYQKNEFPIEKPARYSPRDTVQRIQSNGGNLMKTLPIPTEST